MDIERVNIVFNYDMPEDSDTYLHRVARAGRFGTKGLAITFVSDENDAKTLNNVQDRFDVNITELPDEIDLSSYSKFLDILLFQHLILFPIIFFQSKDDKASLKCGKMLRVINISPFHTSGSRFTRFKLFSLTIEFFSF